MGAFLEECCLVGAQYWTKAGALYEAYKKWAQAANERQLKQNAFGRQLSERGFEREKGHTVTWRGLGLREGE